MRKIPYSLALLFAFLLSIPAFTQEYRPDANTVLLLHMNETSGSTVSDAGPRGWNGSFGAGSFVSGKFGNAFQPGSREGISVPDFSSAGLDERFTAEIWIKLDGAPTSDLSLYSNNSFRRRIQADLSVVFGITHTDSSVVAIHSPPSILTAGKWFHLVGLLENRVTKLYIDGALIGTAAHGLPMITGAAGTTIGQSGMALPLEGLIDEIRVSNKARTPEEFNLQLPPKNLAGTPSRTSVALSWEKGGGMVGCLWYKIYRGEDSTSVGLIDSTTQLSYINTGLSPGKFYFYRVSAVDSTGFESAKSYAVRCYLPIVGEYQADANTVLLLHMNETSDSTAYDASSYGNHGAANNTTTEQGRFGKARRFAAASSNVHVRHSSSLDFGTGSYTLESWVKHFGPVGEGGHLLFKVTVPLGWDLYLRPDGHLQFDEQYDDGRTTSVASSRPMADGRWHHCAAVSTATRQFLYVDGVLDSSTNVTNRGRFDHTADLVIGKSQGTSPFNGLIDEVRISNRARSPEEFNLQLPPKNLSATASRTSVSLIWQNGGGAVPLMRYRIYRGADSTSLSLIDSTTQLLYSNTGLSSGTRFYYRVSAVDSTGFESVKSYALSAVTAPLLGEYAPDTSTVLLLHMNETTGSTVSDASSYGNHGTATGTTIVDGRFGKAHQVAKAAGIAISASPSINLGALNFTLEMWVRFLTRNVSLDPMLFHKWGPNETGPGFKFFVGRQQPDDDLVFSARDTAGNRSGCGALVRVSDGNWHHIAATREGGRVRIYVDGVFRRDGDASALGSVSNNDWLLLASNIDSGQVDEVRISNKARSPVEFNLQLPPKDLNATVSGTSVNLSWQNGGGMVPLMRYRIYRGRDSANVVLIDSTSSTSFVNSGLDWSSTYSYRVSAVDSTGFESVKSYALRASTALLPGEYAVDGSTVLLLHMNETSGGIAYDASSYENSGTASGTIDSNGRFGRARYNQTQNTVILIQNGPSLRFGTGPFTAEAWINALDTSQISGHFHSFPGTGGPGWYNTIQTNGSLSFTVKAASGLERVNGTKSVVDGKWHHIACVRGQNSIAIYVDGLLDATKAISSGMNVDNDEPLLIGYQGGNPYPVKGLIDEVRISNKARSPNEFNLQLPPTNISATGSATAVSLAWQNGGGAAALLRYRIYRGTDSTTIILIDSTTSTSFSDSKVTAGTRYFYRIGAVDVSGFESVRSYAVAALAAGVPTPTSNAATSVGATTATLNGSVNPNGLSTTAAFEWGTSSSLSSYSTSSSQSLGSGGNPVAVKADLTGLTASTTYYFRVMAQNSLGTQRSSILSFTTLPSAVVPSSPADGATNQSTTLTLSWNASPGATRYRLQLSTSTSFSPLLVDDTTLTTTSRQVGPLSYSTTYYWRVSATSAGGTSPFSQTFSFSTVPAPPTTLTLSASVSFPVKAKAAEYEATEYRIVGLPGSSDLAVNALFSGTRNVDWQAYWDNGAATNYLVEFDGSSTFRFSLGRAFWVIARGALNINRIVNSPPLNNALEVEVSLNSGWNLITNPFNSTISWSRIQSTNGTNAPIYTFSGSFSTSSNFDPYVGYYFFNGSPNTTLTKLRVPYASIFTRSSEPTEVIPGGWRINVAFSSGGIIDDEAWIGVSSLAKNGLDLLDARKPRGLPDLAAVYFERTEWDNDFSIFASDIRREIEGSETWRFSTLSETGKSASLSFRGISGVPEEYAVYLIDMERAMTVDLRRDSIYSFVPRMKVSNFKLVVGTPASVQQQVADVVPREFSLSQNFPNPFNPSTAFSVSLPEASEVRISLFNTLGQETRLLYAGWLEAGRHWYVWDGRDEQGALMPSGAYFCVFRVPSTKSFITKMILIR